MWHKLVLLARSPILKAFFRAGACEGEDNRKVKIIDLSSAAFESILPFIYKENLGNEEIKNDMWSELLKGAQKLELAVLRKIFANYPWEMKPASCTLRSSRISRGGQQRPN